MQSFKFLRYALHGDLVEDRRRERERREEERENNAYFNGHFAVCTATLGPIARHILETFPEGMPACYRHFLGNVCKPTSVRGLLQVLSSEPLLYLEQFCKEELNLHAHSSQRQLKCVAASLPAVWPDLNRICNLTN